MNRKLFASKIECNYIKINTIKIKIKNSLMFIIIQKLIIFEYLVLKNFRHKMKSAYITSYSYNLIHIFLFFDFFFSYL